MNSLLTIKDLKVTHAKTGQRIVKNLELDLYRGRALAIMGESGSGKTMTCKAILGLHQKNRFTVTGSISYRGEELLGIEENKLRALSGSKIAMIVQNPMTAFDPTMKLGRQIVETIRAHKRINNRAAYSMGISALEKMNLPRCEHLMNSYPHELSGGMLQRIIITLSLIHKPDVIISDEATTALDVRNQSIVLKEFEKMKQAGIALLLVTHDFGVAARIADDIIVLREGEVIEKGTIYSIFNAPKEDYTKALLKASILKKGESKV